jgi:hypothetical protein
MSLKDRFKSYASEKGQQLKDTQKSNEQQFKECNKFFDKWDKMVKKTCKAFSKAVRWKCLANEKSRVRLYNGRVYDGPNWVERIIELGPYDYQIIFIVTLAVRPSEAGPIDGDVTIESRIESLKPCLIKINDFTEDKLAEVLEQYYDQIYQ